MIRARRKRVQGMDERVTLTNVIIHSGQKTVSRYIRPVVMHHVAFTFSKTKNIMSTRCMYTHSVCVLRGCVSQRSFPFFLERAARRITTYIFRFEDPYFSFTNFHEFLNHPCFII